MANAVTAIADHETRFDYAFIPVSDLRVQLIEDPKTGKEVVSKVLVQDEPLDHTDRFWISLFSRYGFNKAFFKYFNHVEVFERISEVEANDRMRLCIERNETGQGTLLGVSNPTKPIVVYDELMGMLGRYGGQGVTYSLGIVESGHVPRAGVNSFTIGADEFANRFLMATPIDGYGTPNIYLSLMRFACQNLTVGCAKAFKAGLALGKADDDVSPSITRALDGFNNDEGYAALRQRMESAGLSWCSVYESTQLYKLLVKLHSRGMIEDDGPVPPLAVDFAKCLERSGGRPMGEDDVGSAVLKAFHGMTGDTSKLYGLANLDALSTKRQRTLPVRCTVLDAVNFATEVATHYSLPYAQRELQKWVGGLLSEEFDMEQTKTSYSDFQDFFLERKLAVPEVTG